MPPRSTLRSGESLFACDFPGCSSRYRRKEHLKRHQANHERQGNVPCPHCDQKLTRKKVIGLDLSFALPASRSLKACSACRQRKEICEGGSPCRACEQRGIDCSLVEQSPPAGHQGRNQSDPEIPASPSIHDYVKIYFDHFHPEWPFLHESTFDPTKEPGVLVQSVVMLGMWAQGSRSSKNAAIALHSRLASAIQSQRSQWDHSSAEPDQIIDIKWPIATYQSVLLQVIFSIFTTRDSGGVDFGLRHRIPAEDYSLLNALVQSCRNLGIFSYPEMLNQYPAGTPITMIWVGVEEMKRFALALYKVTHICTTVDRQANASEKLMTVADLAFSMPYSDETWSLSKETEGQTLSKATAQASQKRDGDNEKWINSSFTTLHDPEVSFDWI
ncbi:unnamed protein product [Penicillium salamii]|uniref:Zn(2)-C6 fungal-type domain-containing protein n=1 Tax=Penicillium salamii TaxID=1612424 RepID=A0A9W4JAL4_9EURO|nr:unnamed protein product [Penicillium salamii]